jgi:cyclohexanone monooxygenase
MTGAMKEIDIRTDTGLTIEEKWAHGPRTYLGIMMAGFPNLFMITGPQSPGVKSQMILSCEQHVDWIADCLQYLRDSGLQRIEPDAAAEEAYGCDIPTRWRIARSIRWQTPGTLVPIFRASHGCSCPTSGV